MASAHKCIGRPLNAEKPNPISAGRDSSGGARHTAAFKDAYSIGTRSAMAISGGGLIQSRASASNSYSIYEPRAANTRKESRGAPQTNWEASRETLAAAGRNAQECGAGRLTIRIVSMSSMASVRRRWRVRAMDGCLSSASLLLLGVLNLPQKPCEEGRLAFDVLSKA